MYHFIHSAEMQKSKPTPNKLKSIGLFTSREARIKFGVSQPSLSRWLAEGLILRAGRGLYYHPEASVSLETLDFAVACAKFGPKSAIAGLSALFHYQLIDQVPSQIWVLVSPARKDRSPLYRCLRTKTTLRFGINSIGSYRITNLERTLIEAFKFATKIGPRIAIQATRKALRDGITTEKKLGEMAENLKLRNTLEKYWESIVS